MKTLFNSEIKERFYEWGKQNLRPTLIQREEEGKFDREIWKKMAVETGLFQYLAAPNTVPSNSISNFISALFGLSKGSLDIPFLLSVAAHGGASVQLLNHCGTPQQKLEFLPKMASGEWIAALCNSEENAGTDIKGLRSNVTWLSEKQVCLNADKPIISNLSVAGIIFLSAKCPPRNEFMKESIEVFVLRAESAIQQWARNDLAGFRSGATGGLSIKNLTFDFDTARLGNSGRGSDVLKYCFALERIFIPILIAGTLEGMIDLGIEYVEKRQCFGRSISEFQYIQEKLIHIHQTKETILSMLFRLFHDDGVEKVDGFPVDDLLLSELKLFAVYEGFLAATRFFEIFGGKGYVRHPAQKILRDILGLKALGGTEEQQKIVIFQNLLSKHKKGSFYVEEPNRRTG